ncbi:Sec-independent protein translocase protein TatB [Psychromonas antarctica]|jgi:sec-independent protein translocase protein TatB|uniref:Sec-independent protein translocase protein TatB n=1 Tax=Psychromonas antarctica TaxID=67573 RepID=UPI001EE7F9A9|nr:Sec-independent protein translocase protein TatB [Psychromonas antarctica]MCG6201400.1 Sec-independent protein translocase protein TatB [Psychromonas antarctica]
MFDIGFWEIVLISIIGLIVLGPERLPTAIRSVMRAINTAKNMAHAVKTELSQELKLHEMNAKMIKASKQGLSDLDPQLQQSIDEMKKTTQEVTRPYQPKDQEINSSTTQRNNTRVEKNNLHTVASAQKEDKSE